MITRRQLLYGTGVASLVMAVGSCSNKGASTAEDLRGATAVLTLPLDVTPHVADAATASARIAWQVMIGHADVRTANAVVSPSSLAVTLAMLAEGAAGDSLASLDEAFGLTGDDRSAAVGALRQALASYEDLPASVNPDDPPETPVVHQANRVVILDGAEIDPDFLDRLSSYYDTGAKRLPREDAKADLDAWVTKHTAGLIRGSAIEIAPGIRLITQDALLFAAKWRQQFLFDDVPLHFTTGDGATANINALSDTFSIPYAKTEQWEAVRLAYDDVLAMDVILPRPGTHPSELSFEAIQESAAVLGQAEVLVVDLTMPPSDITTKWELLAPLADQGITLGELGRIFGGATVDQMAQQARLIVTAKGTVGAALTEVAIAVSAGPAVDVELNVDRPFIMRVLDTRSGWPVFLTIVNNPTDLPD